ncbi:MAG: nucleoside transporter C-terminal domain-containing protein [Myxococcota bacterium]
MERWVSAIGVFAMVGVAWLLSVDRRRVPWRVIAWGLMLQFTFGVIVLKTRPGVWFFGVLNDAVLALLGFTERGTAFVFGEYASERFTIALNVLPTIIFFSALMTVLYHLGVMQRVVRAFAWLMRRTMRTSGAETLSVAANSFVGMTEAPLMIAPFVRSMTMSELMAVMTGGFATVAGGVLAAYVGMLKDVVPDIAGHLIAASVMSAPAALVVAKVMWPAEEHSAERAEPLGEAVQAQPDVNVIDAAARGASEGLRLALNVGAMLLAFIALVALANALLGLPTALYNDWAGLEGAAAWAPLTIQDILGWIFWPLALLIGIPVGECSAIATLLGEKIVLTEFIAYLHLSEELSTGTVALSPRTLVIASYALCGFANFGSIGIQLGGIGGIAPERRHDLARLGLRAMFGGLLASLMTASIAGLLY